MKKYEITATRPNSRQVTIVTKHAEKAQWVKRDFEAEVSCEGFKEYWKSKHRLVEESTKREDDKN